jgi:spore coat assembly protein SafA
MKKFLDVYRHHRIYLFISGVTFIATMGFTPILSMATTCGATHTVRSGESLFTIATQCGVSLTSLIQANPQLKNPRLIFRGNVINIPGGSTSSTSGGLTVSGTVSVRSGDTMLGIAQRYGISLSLLEQANPQIGNPRLIFPGETINLPEGSIIPSTGGPTVPISGTYTVVSGDTMIGIAQRHGVSLSSLIQANPQIANPRLIFPGEQVNIP